MVVHIFLEGAVVPEGVVTLGGQTLVPTVEAVGCTVTLDGGMEPGAVGGLVLQLKVPQLAANPTPFVVCGAPTLHCVMGQHKAPLTLAVLYVRLGALDFACLTENIAWGA